MVHANIVNNAFKSSQMQLLIQQITFSSNLGQLVDLIAVHLQYKYGNRKGSEPGLYSILCLIFFSFYLTFAGCQSVIMLICLLVHMSTRLNSHYQQSFNSMNSYLWIVLLIFYYLFVAPITPPPPTTTTTTMMMGRGDQLCLLNNIVCQI